MNTTTRTIAGHDITLTAGERYLAERPMASRGRREYPVTIRRFVDGRPDKVAATIDGLTYEAANALLAAFNSGTTSFDGRVW